MNFNVEKKLLILAISSCLSAGYSLPSLAKSNAPATAPQQAPGAAATAREMRAGELIGMQVKNAQGEKIGKIEDLVVDVDNEKVYYATLSFGGALGLGDKLFAFPVSAFGVGKDRHELILNASKEQLKNAPGFEHGRRPNYSAETFRGVVDRYFFKEEVARHTPQGARLIGAKDLIGKKINDHAAHNAGKIADLVVNLGNQRAYAVMQVGSNDKLVALPLHAFTFPGRPDLDLMLNVDRDKIETAHGFEKNKWPDLNSASAQKDINDQLSGIAAQIKPNPAAAQSGAQTSSGSSR